MVVGTFSKESGELQVDIGLYHLRPVGSSSLEVLIDTCRNKVDFILYWSIHQGTLKVYSFSYGSNDNRKVKGNDYWKQSSQEFQIKQVKGSSNMHTNAGYER